MIFLCVFSGRIPIQLLYKFTQTHNLAHRHILCFCEKLRNLQEASQYRQRAREEVQRRAREALREKRSTTTLELSEELRIGDVSCKRGKPERPELVPSTLFVLWHGILGGKEFGCDDMVVPMFQSQWLIKANAKIAMIGRLHLASPLLENI